MTIQIKNMTISVLVRELYEHIKVMPDDSKDYGRYCAIYVQYCGYLQEEEKKERLTFTDSVQ